jgi:hypothetical protein
MPISPESLVAAPEKLVQPEASSPPNIRGRSSELASDKLY